MMDSSVLASTTDTPFEGTEQLTGEKPVYVWFDILDRARAIEANDLVWTWDAFIVVGIVVVDAAAEFGIDEIYGVGTYSFNLSLNILKLPFRTFG